MIDTDTDTGTMVAYMRTTARCASTCKWKATYSVTRQGLLFRHNDGEAVLLADAKGAVPESVLGWLTTLHPEANA